MPSSILSASTPTPSRSDASSRNIRRTSAQACRSARPDCCTDRLPEVTPSLGLAAVEARTIRMRERSTSSSSAAICASAVTMPCPISTFPGETVTHPSAENFSHDDSFGFAARLTGSFTGGGEGACCFIPPPSRSPRAAPPAPCGYANRSGIDCGRALPSRPCWKVTGFVSTAPPRS